MNLGYCQTKSRGQCQSTSGLVLLKLPSTCSWLLSTKCRLRWLATLGNPCLVGVSKMQKLRKLLASSIHLSEELRILRAPKSPSRQKLLKTYPFKGRSTLSFRMRWMKGLKTQPLGADLKTTGIWKALGGLRAVTLDLTAQMTMTMTACGEKTAFSLKEARWVFVEKVDFDKHENYLKQK